MTRGRKQWERAVERVETDAGECCRETSGTKDSGAVFMFELDEGKTQSAGAGVGVLRGEHRGSSEEADAGLRSTEWTSTMARSTAKPIISAAGCFYSHSLGCPEDLSTSRHSTACYPHLQVLQHELVSCILPAHSKS